MKKESSINRRSFLKSLTLADVLGVIGIDSTVGALISCGGGESTNAMKPSKGSDTYHVSELPGLATDGEELRANAISCGKRDSEAAPNFLNAANGITIVVLGDTLQERVDDLAKKLKDERGIDVSAGRCFVGLDAYKQVIDSDADAVIVATPPVSRSVHFRYATEKGEHSFLEKPTCVDPVDYRTTMTTAKQVAAKNSCIVTGIQCRRQHSHVELYKRVMEGSIGEITGGTICRNQNMLRYRDRQPGWNDCKYTIKDWVSWK